MCVIVVVVGPCPEKLSLGTVDVAAGVFFAADFSSVFLVRGSKIGLRSPGFEPGFRTFAT